MQNISQDKLVSYLMLGLMLALFASMACAGTGGTEFDDVYDTVVEWMQGTLGRIIAVSMILVGLVAGVVRQSIMAFVIGVAGGMGLYQAPTVIDAIMSAATVDADKVAAVYQLTNGLM